MRKAIHRERGLFIEGGRRLSIKGGKPFIEGGETICRRQEEAVQRVETIHRGQEEAHRRRPFIGRRPFIRRRPFVEREGRSSREGGGHLLRKGGTGRRPFIKRRGCSLKAIHRGREEAVCRRPFTEGRRRLFVEGGRRPFIEAGGNIR